MMYLSLSWFQDGSADEGDWCLVSCNGDVHPLPKTMIFLGREECDIDVQVSWLAAVDALLEGINQGTVSLTY